ncbi:MAG: DNA polymerase III subunit alpha [Anaerolineaceae bacterium]|nr:DNA polymerase III subunit alpha [Anaerolineaceae bacterium]
MVVHLTTHSAYSLLRGLALPAELAGAARDQNMPALGLTDFRTMTGAVEFVKACQSESVRPILGLELDGPAGKLNLLASSGEGWSNLCRLSSELALGHDADSPISPELLQQFKIGLVALTDGGEQVEALRDIYSGSFYLALRHPADGIRLNSLALRLGVPMVAAWPIYYLQPEQANLQRTVSSIRTLRPLTQLTAQDVTPAEASFLAAPEMERRYQHFPRTLEMTEEVAERCQFDLPLGVPRMPTIDLPQGRTLTQELRTRAEIGAREIYGSITPQLRDRLDHEIEVIARMGFEPIFFIVEDLLNFAREKGIPYSSRGSAASSLVAHCLRITNPDPMRLNLYFERFLNPARSTPPDIDTDLCSERRDEVIQHVFERYGRDRVAMVATINRFRPRSALGDVAKAHGLEPARIREMTAQLPHSFWARFEDTGESTVAESVFTQLSNKFSSTVYRQIFTEAAALLKLPRHLSVHAGGLIVAPGVLTDLVPVMRSGSKGVVITQFDLESVEALGLVKIDLLGIRGLTVLGDVAEFIQTSRPETYRTRLAVLDSVPQEDPAISDRIETGQTIGCFQIESPGMRSTLREIHARKQDDVMAALALYRPGPLKGGLRDAFVRRFQGKEPVAHIHPSLEPLLASTYGVILYQEQVLRIAHEIAGFSLADADLLRRGMSHFDPGKHMQELQAKFVEAAREKSAIPPETGERIWEMMAAFSGYGFPQAHAASYAQVAWRSAWCKNYFPAEFMAAVLANWGGYYSQRVYLGEARRLGLTVYAPNINHSGQNFEADGKNQALYMGLDQVKGLTHNTITKILRLRPFNSLDDFLSRVDPRPQEAESLARVDAFASLSTIPAALQRIQGGSWRAGQMSLFGWAEESESDWTLRQKVAAQEELLGISVVAHPLDLYKGQIQSANAVPIMEAYERIGQRVIVAGLRQASHRSRTAKGETMMFLTLEDLSGTVDVVLFPDVLRKAGNLFANAFTPILVEGTLEKEADSAEPVINASRVVSLA